MNVKKSWGPFPGLRVLGAMGDEGVAMFTLALGVQSLRPHNGLGTLDLNPLVLGFRV